MGAECSTTGEGNAYRIIVQKPTIKINFEDKNCEDVD
jgi:hypothetical protein